MSATQSGIYPPGLTFDLMMQNSKSDGNFYKNIMPDGIIEGCALTNTGTSITVGVGQFIAGGRRFQITTAQTINLLSPIATGYVRLYVKIDLTKTADKDNFIQAEWMYDYSATLGGFTAHTQEDINAIGTTYNTYEVEFAVYALSSSVISTKTRSIDSAVSSIIRDITSWGTGATYNGSQKNAIAWEDQKNVYINLDYKYTSVSNGLSSPATVCTLPAGITLPSATLTKRSIAVTLSAMIDATFTLSNAGVIAVVTAGNATYYSGSVHFVYPKGI